MGKADTTRNSDIITYNNLKEVISYMYRGKILHTSRAYKTHILSLLRKEVGQIRGNPFLACHHTLLLFLK